MFESRRRGNSSKSANEKQYFTIEALGSGYINWGNSNLDSYTNPIYYSKNGGEWVGSTEGSSVTVVSGDKVRFKAKRTTAKPKINFGGTANFNVYGNIMSLIHGDDFVGNNTMFDYAFEMLFSSSSVVDASNLILPAKILAQGCYHGMFMSCKYLKNAPELPATTLANSCYRYMFYGCSKMETAPKLHAPELVEQCYQYMFYYCTTLSYIEMLAIETTANNCLLEWVYGVSYDGVFKYHPAEDLPIGVSGIPLGWSRVLYHPHVPSTFELFHGIELDGTEYIDTEYLPIAETCIKIKFEFTGEVAGGLHQTIFGEFDGSDKRFAATYHINNQSYYMYFGDASASASDVFTTYSPFWAKFDLGALKVKNLTISPKNNNGNFRSSKKLFLGALNREDTVQYPSKCRIYYCIIQENKVAKREYIPVRHKTYGSYGLYDVVNNKYFELKDI